MVFLTRGAVAVGTGPGEPDLALAPVWGLVRSAQLESPERFVLADLDGHRGSWRALPAALTTEEPSVALRKGVLRVPRLARTAAPGADAPQPGVHAVDPRGTVLITAATGALGGSVARHLVAEHGIRHLLLLGGAGPDDLPAGDLAVELAARGAEVAVADCDPADRAALAALLARISPEHPLTAVVHAVAVPEDASVTSLAPERLDATLRPAVDAALNLDELTAGPDLAAFVLLSSLTGALGAPGQGEYAAANAFLDALAQRRRARGLPALSLGWGLWDAPSGLQPFQSGLRLLAAAGLSELSLDEGMDLFDAAYRLGAPVLAPVRFDVAGLAARDSHRERPALLRSLVRRPARRTVGQADGPSGVLTLLKRRLAGLTDPERDELLMDVIRVNVAEVLDYPSPDDVEAEKGFREIGLNSLSTFALRNKLKESTGLRLPAALLFEQGNPLKLAQHLKHELLRH